MDERMSRGLEVTQQLFPDAPARAPEGVPPEFVDPGLAHLFGEIWSRPALSVKLRSLVTVASLLALVRNPETRTHLAGALNVGWTPEQLREVITHVAYYAGFPTALEGHRILSEILRSRV